MGYYRAGFDVVGVDQKMQRDYPFEFHQPDAMTYPLDGFDAIHASPPCQAFTTLRHLSTSRHPDLISATRDRLRASGLPYVIENVVGAPLEEPVMLCGSSFGLEVRRHRLFETAPRLLLTPPCAHYLQPEPIDVSGTGGRQHKPRTKAGGGRGRKPVDLAEARRAIGIDWTDRRGISQAIPPAYTEWIGKQLIQALRVTA
jgi:DNA (cytosine-5)-methyltransferase 1